MEGWADYRWLMCYGNTGSVVMTLFFKVVMSGVGDNGVCGALNP